jgi:hypothetical protein
MLSLLYGTFCSPSLGIRIIGTNHFFVKDTSAFLIIVFSVKRRARGHTFGVPSLLDRIVRDATMYFLVIFSSHLLLILFELFAPVSDFLADLVSSAHDGPRIGTDSTPSSEVCRHPKHYDEDELNGTFYYLAGTQCEFLTYCIKLHILD